MGCRSGDRRREAVAGKTHAPKTEDGFGKFKFHVAADAAIVFGFDDLADDFFFGLFVGEKEQLSRSDGGLQADDGAVAEDEDGFGGLGEGFTLIAAFHGARAVDGDTHFEGHGLRFGLRLGSLR